MAADSNLKLKPTTARAVDGAHIAADRCDACHMVLQPTGTAAAVPFASIAVHRSSDQVRAFLAQPHGGSPFIALSAEQIEDIMTYMKSLGAGPDNPP
jgi:mono/diheme cytochrome c family protein